ncbi:MAG: glycosyltransferase [Acidobacteriaceae bacterium]|nr:glycosyltransferase [Acidobacteriaceae bacterium]
MDVQKWSQTELLFALDTPSLVPVSPEESFLKGWFVPPSSVKTSRLILTVDGKEQPIYTGFPRLDVQRHLNGGGSRSGFVALLQTPQPGQCVGMVVRLDEVDYPLVSDIPVEQRQTSTDPSLCNGKVSTYRDWLFECEPQLFQNNAESLKNLTEKPDQPVISLLVEYRECHLYFLSRLLRSLSAQIYPDWQLCITGDFDEDSESFQYAEGFAASDSRVMITPAGRSKHHGHAMNAALEAACGEFIAPIRICDELHPSALLEIAASLQGSKTEVVYSDEDQIDLFGQRSRPKFKPDFDRERLLALDYIRNLTAIRRSLVLKSGGFGDFPTGAREWDLLLRCCEQIEANKVRHIAKPLYHLRAQETVQELGFDIDAPQSKDLCQVVRDHVRRTAKQIIVQVGFPTDTVRLQYQVPKHVGISIFFRDEDGAFQTAAFTKLTDQYRIEFYGVLNQLVHRLPSPFEDGTGSVLRPPLVSFEEIADNVLIFINRPIDSLNHYFVQELAAQTLREDCGLVTGLAVDLQRRFVHTGFIGKENGRHIDPFAGTNSRTKALSRHVKIMRSVEAISEEFFAVRRSHVEAVGGFSELNSSRMLPFVRMLTEHAHRRGLLVLVTPYAIGAFDDPRQQLSPSEALHPSRCAIACFNQNLAAFSDPYSVLQAE